MPPPYQPEKNIVNKPNINKLLNIYDFAALASHILSKRQYDYIITGADNEIAVKENERIYQRIMLRPKVFRNTTIIKNTNTHILGYPVSCPIYITSTGRSRNAHSEGETAINKACFNENIIQMTPSYCLNDIQISQLQNQCVLVQLYARIKEPKRKEATKNVILNAIQKGCKGIVLTVDITTAPNRPRDRRPKTTFNRTDLEWDDLLWIKSLLSKSINSNMKLILKGVQCGEDVLKAIQYDVDAVILSNHGGRVLDYARSSIEILIEVMEVLDANNLRNKIEVWIDGGIRRGTDIFKAIALGATAVGIGRACLYGLACYGQQGVEKIVQILKNELLETMKFMGTITIKDINKNAIIYRNINTHLTLVPVNHGRESVYSKLHPVTQIQSKL
eukprot:118583_1